MIMSTHIETKLTGHTLVQVWGGDDKGMVLQVTCSEPLRIRETVAEQLQDEGFIRLTMEEAATLCNDLGAFVRREAVRRQELLSAEIERLKIAERTVFHEVAELPSDLMAGPELAVEMVSRFCPKSASQES